MSEELETAKEIAKATRAVAELSASAGRFLDQVIGNTLRELGAAAEDWAKLFRLKNFYTVVDKAHKIIERRKIQEKPIPIPPDSLLPLIEGSSLEASDSVQNLWAALLANAADPATNIRPRKVFIEILRGLEPLDAQILEFLARPEIEKEFSIMSPQTLSAEYLAEKLNADLNGVLFSLQSLHRYACIIDSWEQTLEQLDKGYQGFRVNNPKSNFRLSHLGKALVDATKA